MKHKTYRRCKECGKLTKTLNHKGLCHNCKRKKNTIIPFREPIYHRPMMEKAMICLTKGQKKLMTQRAKEKRVSMSQYVRDLIKEDLGNPDCFKTKNESK